MANEEPQCRAHAAAIVDALPRGVTVRTVAHIGTPYAVRSQSARLGWPATLEDELVQWIRDNHAATRSGDRNRMREVAERFDQMIRELLDTRRSAPTADVTSELLHDTVDGRPLTTEEIVSILRNWTAGDLGSLATSVGVLVRCLASHSDIQRQVRSLVAAGDRLALAAAAEEILRIDDPFVFNRRVATRTIELGGETITEGESVLLNWTAANRDPSVFGDPDRFDLAGQLRGQPRVRDRTPCVSRPGADAHGAAGDARGAARSHRLDRAGPGSPGRARNPAGRRLGAGRRWSSGDAAATRLPQHARSTRCRGDQGSRELPSGCGQGERGLVLGRLDEVSERETVGLQVVQQILPAPRPRRSSPSLRSPSTAWTSSRAKRRLARCGRSGPRIIRVAAIRPIVTTIDQSVHADATGTPSA